MRKNFRKISCRAVAILMVLFFVLQPIEVSAYKAGAHAVLVADVANNLPQNSVIRRAILKYPRLAAWGATGPDIPANTAAIVIDRAPWFETYHYEKAASMAAEQLRLALASGDEQVIAFAAGWVTHEVGDLYCHGVFVNPDPDVGGVYLANPDSKEMHGKLEAYADRILYEDRSNPKKSYNPINMLMTFGNFGHMNVIANAQIASFKVHGDAPSPRDFLDWTDFFTDVYLTTGVAGATNWVYSNSYQEAKDMLAGGKPYLPGEPFYNKSRIERLNLSYEGAKSFSIKLLTEAEGGNYDNFSDAWNLDAYHLDGRSIGTLTVRLETDFSVGAGTDDDIKFGMYLENGQWWESAVLDKHLYNDFEMGDFDDYYLYVPLENFPIDKINKIYLKKESDGTAGGWKCKKIEVSINGKNIYDKNINTWLEDDHLTWTGDIVKEEQPRKIGVGITGEASAVTDKIQGFAHTLNGANSASYKGEIFINIKRKDGTSENYTTMTNEQGAFLYNIQLKPQDYVTLRIEKVDETNPKITYVGKTYLGFAKVPFDSLDFNGDAFNDVIKGTVSGAYTGPLEITIENGSASRTLNTNAAQGQFSVPVQLVGGDKIKVSLEYEDTEFPMEPLFHDANLNILEMKYTKTDKDISGTISNNFGLSAKPYTGKVMLCNLMAEQLMAEQNAIVEKASGKGRRLNTGNSSTSMFLFKDVVDNLKLGFSIVIEHDGISKSIAYDPLSEVKNEANKPLEKDIYSIGEERFDPRINPFENNLNPIKNSINPGLNINMGSGLKINSNGAVDMNIGSNININTGAASGMNSAIKMAPTQNSTSWGGIWTTDFGTLIVMKYGDSYEGMYGDREYKIIGKVDGNIFKGTFTEVSATGEFEFAMSQDGKGFTGKRKLMGESQWQIWNGKQ